MKVAAMGCFLGFIFTFLFTLYRSQVEKAKHGKLPSLSRAKYRKMYVSSFVFLGIFIIALLAAKGMGDGKAKPAVSDPPTSQSEIDANGTSSSDDLEDDDKHDKEEYKKKRKHDNDDD